MPCDQGLPSMMCQAVGSSTAVACMASQECNVTCRRALRPCPQLHCTLTNLDSLTTAYVWCVPLSCLFLISLAFLAMVLR